jgi:lysophospholipase L1-like esterase
MEKATKILFTGDSITDAMRTELVRGMGEIMAKMGTAVPPHQLADRTNNILGTGYPALIAAQLGFEHPGRYTVLNRGISGHRIVDLDARVKADCINLEPDFLSILIGINDVWHELMFNNGVAAAKFERVYDAMLAEVLQSLPGLKLILIEPFVLRGSATEEKWEQFRTETELRRAATERLARKYGAALLPAAQLFDDAATKTSAADWCADGVHPTAAGHWLLAQAWLKLFRSLA